MTAPISDLSYSEFLDQWDALTESERQRVRDKAARERMSPWAALNEWPSLRTDLSHEPPRNSGEGDAVNGPTPLVGEADA